MVAKPATWRRFSPGTSGEAPDRDPGRVEGLAHEVCERDGVGIVAVQADRGDSLLCEAEDLRLDLGGIAEDGVWVGSRSERAVGAISAIGEAFGHEPDARVVSEAFDLAAADSE